MLGGLGTGIGDGDRGAVCGREGDCWLARDREHEVDARDHLSAESSSRPGYERHEMEGIGGVMKKKLVRIVRVGACVPEWEDEKVRSECILAREIKGVARSWCGWCDRVIPGATDRFIHDDID